MRRTPVHAHPASRADVTGTHIDGGIGEQRNVGAHAGESQIGPDRGIDRIGRAHEDGYRCRSGVQTRPYTFVNHAAEHSCDREFAAADSTAADRSRGVTAEVLG